MERSNKRNIKENKGKKRFMCCMKPPHIKGGSWAKLLGETPNTKGGALANSLKKGIA